MKINLNFSWQKYALIIELAQRLEGRSLQFGKTMLQKMIYLLQEAFHIDCGYDFELYTYGPFSTQLLQDLDLVEHFRGVEVNPVKSITGGYEISPGEKAEIIKEKGAEFLNKKNVKKAISNLINEFGNFGTKDLELRSTIIFVQRELMRQEKPSKNKVKQIVKEIKPKFTDEEIYDAMDELEKKKYIQLN